MVFRILRLFYVQNEGQTFPIKYSGARNFGIKDLTIRTKFLENQIFHD